MLHARRRRLADLAAREVEGESFWSESFEMPLRVRLVHLMNDMDYSEVFTTEARKMILRDEGVFTLSGSGRSTGDDFRTYVLSCPDDMMPTVIEAFDAALNDTLAQVRAGRAGRARGFAEVVNGLLREHRLSYEFDAGEMVPFSSRELHVEVVAPTLRLLGSDPTWHNVELSYRNALEELSKGDAADAVTDAGTALQEALTTRGADGKSLGPLIKSARSKGILAAHDAPMLDAIERVLNWVSADRSNTGDSHNAAPARIEDAWLIVHVVGALILRISTGSDRPGA